MRNATLSGGRSAVSVWRRRPSLTCVLTSTSPSNSSTSDDETLACGQTVVMVLAASAFAISSCSGARVVRAGKRFAPSPRSAAAAARAARHWAALQAGPSRPKPAASAWAMRSRTVARERPGLRAIGRIHRPARQCTKISTSSSTVILLRAMPSTSSHEEAGRAELQDDAGWVISVTAGSYP